MKKITIITFLSLCLFVINTQAQDATKQETIDWIVSKFRQNPNGKMNLITETEKRKTTFVVGIKFKAFKDGVITFETYQVTDTYFKTNGNYDQESYLSFLNIDLNSVQECISSSDGRRITLNGSKVRSQNSLRESEGGNYDFHNKKYELSPDWFIDNSIAFFVENGLHDNVTFIDFNSEPNLKDRMVKAFQALAKFNNAGKPKEKY